MDTYEFNDRHFNPSLEMSSKANRSISMLGDFDMDLLKHDYHAPTNEFLDSLTSMFFKEELGKHSVLGNYLKNFNKVLTLLQLIWQRNQLGHNIRCQNTLADRRDHRNVSNVLQYITYKLINALTSESQVALIDSNPIIYNYHIHGNSYLLIS